MTISSLKSRPALRKTLFGLVAGLVLFGLLGAFAAPHLVRSLAEKHGSAFLGRTLTVQEVAINPYTLELSASGIRLLEANGKDEALTLDRVAVDVEWSSLFRGAPVVRSVEVDRPVLKVVRLDEHGQFNFSDVLQKILDQPPSEEPARFSINNIQLRDGRIDIDDQPFARKHVISDIRLGLPFVSNLPADVELFVEPSLAARINDAPFSLNGKVKPFVEEREAALKIEFNALNLARFDEYSPVPLGFRITSGSLDTDIELSFRQARAGGDPLIALHGAVELRDLELDSRDGKPLFKLPALDVVLNEIQPLAGKIDIASIRIDQPDFEIARGKDGRLNLLALQPRPRAGAAETAPAPTAARPAAPPEVKVGLFEVMQARVAFTDEQPAKAFSYAIEPMDIVLRDFSLQGDEPATLVIGAQGEGNVRLSLDAKLRASKPDIEGELTVSGVDLPRFSPYFADLINFSVDQAQARLGTRFGLRVVDGAPQGEVVVTEAGIARLKLTRRGEKQPFAQAEDISVTGARIDVSTHKVAVDSVDLIKPRLRAARLADGGIDLAGLVRAGDAPAAPARPASAAGSGSGPAWVAQLSTFNLKDGAVRFEDRGFATPAVIELDRIALKLENVGTDLKQKSKVDFGFRDARGGLFGARGGFALSPVQADLKLDARRLDLMVAQPWLAQKLNAELLAGVLSLRGDLGVKTEGADWALAWNGETNVENIHLTEKTSAADLLKWRSLFAGGIALKLDSRKPDLLAGLSINEVALSDYFARIIVSPQGRLNLQDVVRKDAAAQSAPTPAPVAAAKPAPAPAAPPPAKGTAAPAGSQSAALAQMINAARPPIDVKTVVMQGGRVDFSDFFIKPNYRAQLSELGGRVSGLSSASGTAGEVELRGVVEGSAPISITGRINPLAESLFLDIKASARGIELAPLSPYSGKYVGYGIEKGKLSVNIAYKIDKDQLTAQNNVILDQLTFGSPVDSPDAIKAPVLLAVSLLKDRNGVIDINLPISGSLSDPQFSIGGIVVKVIVNLIVKAVTSPFALLGSLFGSDADLDHVAFEPGRAVLNDEARGKLDTLGKALTDRPALKLEVTGRTDRATDIEGYRRALLDQKVRAAKAARAKTSVEGVTVSPDEYPELLKAVYKASDFPKPRNVVGMAKDLPVPEMEKLILTNTEVSEEDLRLLGLARAQAVKDYLSRNAKIDDARLFVLAPKAGEADRAAEKTEDKAKDSKAAPSRADFSIKN
ncbi:hypothetical protein METUNv1_00478 [Methyloversatilis universalis FAM5]|uniref:DUF748 domain-containing protein n=1 Tax=Methyloversatilis universalis (strain ATCC BAA-1314 / DSM 25237 / JCM 13912 / CCUG 52030 / FAM5) TaxID=1000565 RepID=F5R842_METUF|nr:DUF748 domain-containing protein [Methyloversatilis universalis]EGK73300.1 hypothetical protein METUNv1_00478 [Methyloversatilis universalis FAM5]